MASSRELITISASIHRLVDHTLPIIEALLRTKGRLKSDRSSRSSVITRRVLIHRGPKPSSYGNGGRKGPSQFQRN